MTNSLVVPLQVYIICPKKVGWYSKKNITVDKSTCSYDFVFDHNCVENIAGLTNNIQFFGLPIIQKICMFGDNKYGVDSSIHPHAKLHKQHTALSFYWLQEDISYNMVAFYHDFVGYNSDDIISKHWSYSNIWGGFHPLLFYMGDTMDLLHL